MKRRHLEHDAQCAVIRWAAYNEKRYPELRLIFAIPNGGTRHLLEAARLKAEGVRRGVPDLCLSVARHSFHGLYIEMKSPEGKISEEQHAFMNALTDEGYRVACCRSSEAAISILEEYLKKGEENE